jgi:hypothetical protein
VPTLRGQTAHRQVAQAHEDFLQNVDHPAPAGADEECTQGGAVIGRGHDIVACLIVRDEAARLPGCLASLTDHVAGVLVYDTGSTDGTQDLARAAGAHVVAGTWSGDFAEARNAALQAARGAFNVPWVLSIDADEQLVPGAGVARLTDDLDVDAYTVAIENRRTAGSYVHHAVRLFRADRCRWSGAVHERIVSADVGGTLAVQPAPPGVLRLLHHGYATPEVERRKGARNAELAEAALSSGGGDRTQLRLDLARSLLSAGLEQDALDTFLSVRDGSPHGSAPWCTATDFVTRMLLAAEEHELALALVEDLRRGNGPAGYCDWLAAQALVHLGQAADAWQLLEPLEHLTDTDGRELAAAALHETQALAASLVGEHAKAADLIATAIADDGQVAPRLELARTLWSGAGRPLEELEPAVLRRARPDLRDAIVTELAQAEG